MRSEWRIRALSDVLEEVIDYRGKTPKKMGGDWTNTGYRVFSAKHIKTGRTVKEAEIRTVSQEVYDKWMQIEVERGDIILTSEAPFGEALHWDSDEKIVLGQRLYGLRADSAVINSKFLYYTVIGHHFQQQLSARSTGTTVRGLRQPELLKCTVPVPSLATQTAIADTLSCLDAKIEMNNKINENLEAQAQAIFKSWFVDFEPFQDGEFVESELGLIPEGWHVKSLSEIVASTIAGDWGKAEPEGNHTAKVYCIRGADIPDVQWGNKGKMPTRYTLPKNIESKRLQSGNLVVEISGGSPTQSTGRVVKISDYLLGRYDADMICTNFCRALSVEPPYSTFLYRYWLHMYDLGIMFGYENGTTGIKNFDLPSFLKNTLIALPPNEVLEEYNGAMDVFEARVYGNGLESEVLSTLRDTLLPKLMSGEIEVPVD